MDFKQVAESMPIAACVVSVEKRGDTYGKVRLVTGNKIYIDTIEHPMTPDLAMLKREFVPNSEYTDYMTRDLNFEDSCYHAAVKKTTRHAYAHPARFDVWFDMTFLPLWPDDGDICYCMYT